MSGYGSFDDQRIKHMDMIQAVVGRLGNDSFLVKGWAITVAGAFLGFAVSSADARLAAAGLLPTLLFWGLDAYFLRSERLFRALYDCVRIGDENIAPFFMGATSPEFRDVISKGTKESGRHTTSWWKTFRGISLVVFYGALLAANGLIALVICTG